MSNRIAALFGSLILTMRLFSEPPRGRIRREPVIEQVIDQVDGNLFDPREIVAGRVVITLPIDRDAEPRRLKAQFGLN